MEVNKQMHSVEAKIADMVGECTPANKRKNQSKRRIVGAGSRKENDLSYISVF
jgi:hypothetical protein